MLSSPGRRPAVFITIGLLLGVHLTLIVSGVGAPEARAQIEPEITHQGVDCIITQKHAIIRAIVRPSDDIRVVRVYFRSVLYPEFYFVEAKRDGDVFEAVIPRPKPETKRIVYYIEAVTHGFATARTNNFEPDVTETACDDDDVVPPYFAGEDPNIITGITQAGVPAIPPGFEAIGVVGRNFPTVPVAIGAGAAAAGVGILASGSDDTGSDGTTSPPPGGSTSTSSVASSTTTSTISAESPVACFSVEPDPPRIRVGDTVRFDADCSTASQSAAGEITAYQWDFGDGRGGKEGRFVQRKYEAAGTFTATLTVTNQMGLQDTESRDVVVEEAPNTTTAATTSITTSTTTSIPNEADASISKSGPGSVALNTNFNYTVTVQNNGPRDASNVTIQDNLPGGLTLVGASFVPASAGTCTLNFGAPSVTCTAPSLVQGTSKTVTITVRTATAGTYLNRASVSVGSPPDPNPGNNTSNTVSTGAALTALEEVTSLASSFVSELSSEENGHGQVVINGQRIDSVDTSTPFAHHFRAPLGENTVEAYLTGSNAREGIWRFDFREAAHFVPGSIQVDSGQVVTKGPQEVVFRVTGTGGPPLRFRYRLER